MKLPVIRELVFALAVFLWVSPLWSQQRGAKTNQGDELKANNIDISEQLNVFYQQGENSSYRIALCADVPNNRKPLQVAHNQETGHVFLILQKISAADTVSKVFGFYPKKGLPTLFFKTIASRIKDNSLRKYDVEIAKIISRVEFDSVLARVVMLSRHIYHINKFNCYDYALQVFNTVAGADALPVNHTRFPFVFGRGGSPCCVYKDLKKLKESNSVWATHIKFGELRAPMSTGRQVGDER